MTPLSSALSPRFSSAFSIASSSMACFALIFSSSPCASSSDGMVIVSARRSAGGGRRLCGRATDGSVSGSRANHEARRAMSGLILLETRGPGRPVARVGVSSSTAEVDVSPDARLVIALRRGDRPSQLRRLQPCASRYKARSRSVEDTSVSRLNRYSRLIERLAMLGLVLKRRSRPEVHRSSWPSAFARGIRR